MELAGRLPITMELAGRLQDKRLHDYGPAGGHSRQAQYPWVLWLNGNIATAYRVGILVGRLCQNSVVKPAPPCTRNPEIRLP